MTGEPASGGLREGVWPRFLEAPDGQLVARLYEPGLSRANRYDRCCAYFSSSVLAAAASGFGAFIARILTGVVTEKPALRLLVNEELQAADVDALLGTGLDNALAETLLDRLGEPVGALQKRRLEMLAWLARDGWLEMRVGVMRVGGGILHAKFGLFTDAVDDAVVFAGSGNESAQGLRGNYEQLELSTSWGDQERHATYRGRFDSLWDGVHPAVATVLLPDAVRDKLVRLAPNEPPVWEAADDTARRRAAMLWEWALSTPFMPEGGGACDAMAPVRPWPHQLSVVRDAAAAWPDGRLLCDEVGMGKTVEAILALRRLLAGRGVRRTLLLTPANLLSQWQGELREKGGLHVPRLEGLRTLVWPTGTRQPVNGLAEALEQDLLLISRETARMDANLPILLAASPWDLVLLDEGHAARRAQQVEGEFNSPTLLLGLLRRLQATGQARGLMILSATPMQTHPWEPWDLLQVLGEGGVWLSGFGVVRRFYEAAADLERGPLSRSQGEAVARTLVQTPSRPPLPNSLSLPPPDDAAAFAEALRFLDPAARCRAAGWLRSCSPLSRRMHRNTRATLRRYYEQGLLDRPPARRSVREDAFDFVTADERAVYGSVTSYMDKRFTELEGQKPGKGFVMTIYRRRAASSPVALRKSLERRVVGLQAVIAQRAFDDALLDLDDAAEFEDLLNVQLTSALPESPEEAAAELREIEVLLARIEGLGPVDTKRDRLVERVRELAADGRAVLVFTGFSDTMAYLRDAVVGAFGDRVASYSGDGGALRSGSTWLKASKDDVTAALRSGRAQVLICTDAASEGLNLQAASALVNYDLPWNPSKVEQRIGRIDRIGQAMDVLPIVNFYLQGSVDQRVYKALADRCGLFERFVGPMQPVLSRALRMLIGREEFDDAALAELVGRIEAEPSIAQAFEDAEPVEPQPEPTFFRIEDGPRLLAALKDTGVDTKAEGRLWIINGGGLRIAAEGGAVLDHPEAATVDGLDRRQWALLRQLQRPGDRSPLVVVSVEKAAFRSIACAWLTEKGTVILPASFHELEALVTSWNGYEPSAHDVDQTRRQLLAEANLVVDKAYAKAETVRSGMAQAQRLAARLRLMEELGRTLSCFEPETSDLNGKLHRLMQDRTPTAQRLRSVFHKLGGYPQWEADQLNEIRAFRSDLSTTQVKTRLIPIGVDHNR